MKLPVVVRPIIMPFCTKNPPLLASGPVETSMVKSTLVGGAGNESASEPEQPESVPRQVGSKRTDAPAPIIATNSFLVMNLAFYVITRKSKKGLVGYIYISDQPFCLSLREGFSGLKVSDLKPSDPSKRNAIFRI